MARYEFKSVFRAELQNYIADKKSQGFKEEIFRRNLISFDKFCYEEGLDAISFPKQVASKWILKRDEEYTTSHYSRVNVSKHFLKYLSIKGYDVYVVRDVPYKGTDFVPHIYTDDEVARYFAVVDSYSSSRNRRDAIQYPLLFRILYCCGTRINETLGIRKQDVDFDKGIILLNETKNDKQRYVVMGSDLLELFNDYADKCFYLIGNDGYIFTNCRGGRLGQKHVYDKHREFLIQAGIPYLGDGKGPRVHDWRHTMAVKAFKNLVDSGMGMYVALPILSTYLGHKTIFATEKYVRLTMQMFPYIAENISKYVDEVFGGRENEND